MNVAAVFWTVYTLLFFLGCFWAIRAVRAYGPRARSAQQQVMDTALKAIESRPSESELHARWSDAMMSCRGLRKADDIALVRVAALYDSSPSTFDRLRRLCSQYIKCLNDLAELVDEGLLRPKDLVRRNPALHSELLVTLHLVEPVIWYESLVNGAGRWGYRVSRLRTIMVALRPESDRKKLHSEISIEIGGLNLASLGPVGRIQLISRRFALKFRSPSINMKSKRRQNIYAEYLRSALTNLGIPIPRPEYVLRSAEW